MCVGLLWLDSFMCRNELFTRVIILITLYFRHVWRSSPISSMNFFPHCKNEKKCVWCKILRLIFKKKCLYSLLFWHVYLCQAIVQKPNAKDRFHISHVSCEYSCGKMNFVYYLRFDCCITITDTGHHCIVHIFAQLIYLNTFKSFALISIFEKKNELRKLLCFWV